jgi:hypothetical protein
MREARRVDATAERRQFGDAAHVDHHRVRLRALLRGETRSVDLRCARIQRIELPE